ncbi:MAG: radical SAM protein, partial [Deltaproteobacteria bacterium]|nr:radical SAM protein [Deltaproteobacteria bacterium]
DLIRQSLRVERDDARVAVRIEIELWPRGVRRLPILRGWIARKARDWARVRLERLADDRESAKSPRPLATTWTIGPGGAPGAATVFRCGETLHMETNGDVGRPHAVMTGDVATYFDRPVDSAFACPDRLFVPDLPPDATDIFLDVTRRCNLRCHACFASANESDDVDPAVDDVLAVLGRVKTRPLVSIKGGEPTVRRELPEFIRAIRRMGFPLKVNTNGLKFADAAYARAIRDAGCDTVCLQWDGEDDAVIEALRGRALLDTKRAALQNLSRMGFHVILAFMLVEHQTGRHLREVIDFALRNPNISLVGILPVSKIGRNEFGTCGESLSMADAFRLIERDLAPKLLHEDFRVAQRLAARVSSMVGGAKFRALSCCLGQFLLHRDGDFVPATRLLSLREWRGRPWLPRAAGALAWRIVTGRLTHAHPSLLGIVVEKFMDSDGFDLGEAMACRKYYLAPGGFISPCVYNTIAAG